MSQITPQSAFQEFIARTAAVYQGDREKMRQFQEALQFLQQHIVEGTSTGLIAEHAGIRYTVTFGAEKSLLVQKGTQAPIAGWIRQLGEIRESLTAEGRTGYCGSCRRVHKKYGMEVEVNFLQDSYYKHVLLRKLNGRLNVNTSADDFGIDGGGPLELRNINGMTADEVTREYQIRWDKLLQAGQFMRDNFPDVQTSVNTNRCGIHVHMFHGGIPREKVLTAHTLAGLVVNSYDIPGWRSRLQSGYGTPWAHRDCVDWCQGGTYATELRMFNVIKADALKLAIEKTEEFLQNSFNLSQRQWVQFLETRSINLAADPQNHVNACVAFMVHHGVAKFNQVRRMVQWIDNYDSRQGRTGTPRNPHLSMETVLEQLRTFRPRRTPGQTAREAAPAVAFCGSVPEYVRAATQTTTVTRRGQRQSWCPRVAEALAHVGTSYESNLTTFRANFNTHLRLCESCYSQVQAARGNGVHLVVREHPEGSGCVLFGFFQTNGGTQ